MAYQIVFKKRFINKLIKTLSYLEEKWSLQVASDFLKKLEHRLEQLSGQPFVGVSSEIRKEVRAILITRHNRLYYKVKGRKVIVLNMYDTRANPGRKKY